MAKLPVLKPREVIALLNALGFAASFSDAGSPRLGRKVKVLYYPDNPHNADIAAPLTSWILPLVLLVIGLGVLYISVVVSFFTPAKQRVAVVRQNPAIDETRSTKVDPRPIPWRAIAQLVFFVLCALFVLVRCVIVARRGFYRLGKHANGATVIALPGIAIMPRQPDRDATFGANAIIS
jgi:hypothetical protein